MLAFFKARMINGCRAKAAVAIGKGNIDEGLAYIAKAIEFDKSFAPSYRDQGIAYLISQQYTLAEKSLLKAIELNDREIESRDVLAAIYSEQGKTEAVKAMYEQALQFEPQYAGFYYNYAKFLKGNRQQELARFYFQKALTFGPDDNLRRQIINGLDGEERDKEE